MEKSVDLDKDKQIACRKIHRLVDGIDFARSIPFPISGTPWLITTQHVRYFVHLQSNTPTHEGGIAP